MTIGKHKITPAAIEEFWNWFSAEADHISYLQENKDHSELALLLDPRIKGLHKDLAWEVGPGKNTACQLTVTSAGNRNLRSETDRVISYAPFLPGWEFYPARQPTAIPTEVRLTERNIIIPTSDWKFSPRDDLESGKIDVIIVDSILATSDKNSAFSAAFIVLDALLGEDAVEEWIGKINFALPGEEFRRLYPISDLTYYVEWATTHPDGPLTRVRA